MAKQAYNSDLGVAEVKGTFDEALALIGTQDEKGRTIAICYVEAGALSWIPMAARMAAFVVILLSIFIQRPFGWIPESWAWGRPWLQDLQEWQMFSWFSYGLAILLFGLYVVMSYIKDRYYVGIPGADIHFSKHGQVIDKVGPGDAKFIIDPRVKPSAIVLCKDMPLQMPEVTGQTRDQVSMTYRGALMIRVRNSLELLTKGGFERFFAQLLKMYISIINDNMVRIAAQEFNHFLISSVALPASTDPKGGRGSLDDIEQSELDVEMIQRLSEIAELSMSKIDLDEENGVERKRIVEALKTLAESYGIEVFDTIPLGNSIKEDYLKSLAIKIVSALVRLKQAVEMLHSIKEEEIEETINTKVAAKLLAVLEIGRIITEINAVTATLEDEKNAASIIDSKRMSISNAGQTLMAPEMAKIDALLTKVRALGINTAGIERSTTEWEQLLKELEDHLEEYVPHIQAVVAENLSDSQLVSELDIITLLLKQSKTEEALKMLEQDPQAATDEPEDQERSVEQSLADIDSAAKEIDVKTTLERIAAELAEITSTSGISIEAHTPERVDERLRQITEQAGVSMAEEA